MALDGVGGTVCNAQQYNQSLELRLNGNRGHSISSSRLKRGKCIGLAVSIWSISLRLELIQFTVNSRSIVHYFH